MKSLEDLNRLLNVLSRHKMPTEQILWMGIDEYSDTCAFLNKLGSDGVRSVSLADSNPELECIRIVYGGYTLNIVNY